MKYLFLVLGLLILNGCTLPVEDDMGKNSYGDSGGWSGTGEMHNNGTSANAHLQVNFLEKDTNRNPSKNYTVQFSVGPTKNASKAARPVPVNPVAEIKWSVEGNDVRRLVSVTNGLSLTGVGEAIKVSVLDQSFPFLDPIAPHAVLNVTYDVDITVAPGSRASVNQPPTFSVMNTADGTFEFDVLAAGTQIIQIPQDAGVISSYVTVTDVTNIPIAEGGTKIVLTDVFGNGLREYDPRAGWVPVVAGANLLLLKNHAATTQRYSVTFGIDG